MRRAGRARMSTLRAITIAAVVSAASLSGCSADSQRDAGRTGPPAVVASTDVWGSVARAVAGDDANVSSIITSASADPHSFDASPSDAAAISDASIVVFNGGGYDPWVQAVLDNHPGVTAIDAYSLLDAAAVGEPQPANEHVFYDLGTAGAVASELATRLSEADPGKAAEYRSRAEEFAKQADAIRATERALAAQHPGAAVVATEPVAHYLVRAAGLTDKTPPGYTDAIEQDTDPAPVDVAAVLDLIAARDVAVLLFNEQTVTEATRQVRQAAEQAGVPVVPVSETLPAGTDYLTWQRDTVKRLAAALGERR
ncbi:metal ABC transporter solute-binding protein, Zn/Mn family [Mycolicibacterium sp.]|uniref:metal ABC transporter solute-binding protein, Zn/Mn family n=1 Tax=Mycolicibacterium sp. TaxID=2320850 RepID=UPI0028B0121E|nr:zinc ABC transporter substrate-binding protein [Mycolicibacterium sp.]